MTDLELNTAIAELLGAPKTHNWGSNGIATTICRRCGKVELLEEVNLDPCIPSYATDLNRAVAAGRTLGMFDYDVSIHPQCGQNKKNGAGVVHSWEYNDGEVNREMFEHLAVDFESPARAVCAAILKFCELKNSQKIHGDGDHAWLT